MKVDSDVKKIFIDHEIIGMVADDTEYSEILMGLLGVLNEDYNKILYISITKPYKMLVKEFGENKLNLNKFIFIDCITKTSENPKSTENCIYVSSPKAIDEISTVVMDILNKQKIDVTLIDSPSDLLTYYEDIGVLQFMHRLMSELLVAGCKGIFPFQKESAGTLKRSVEMFTDVSAGLYLVETVLKIRALE